MLFIANIVVAIKSFLFNAGHCRLPVGSYEDIPMRAAGIVHTEILQVQYKFNGLLIDEQYDSNPLSLTALDQMIWRIQY